MRTYLRKIAKHEKGRTDKPAARQSAVVVLEPQELAASSNGFAAAPYASTKTRSGAGRQIYTIEQEISRLMKYDLLHNAANNLNKFSNSETMNAI